MENGNCANLIERQYVIGWALVGGGLLFGGVVNCAVNAPWWPQALQLELARAEVKVDREPLDMLPLFPHRNLLQS